MRKLILLLVITICTSNYCQDILTIDSSGNKLKQFYLSLNVEHLWISGHHINWETGEPDKENAKEGIKTHCSAFVASACKRLGIYILRPPEHGQVLLSNAQYDWLFSKEAHNEGWKKIDENIYFSAQQYANNGFVVLAAYKNPDDKKAGHIALVMPTETSKDILKEKGPFMIQAGVENSNSINLKEGFKHHIKNWPENEIMFFYNDKKLND